jgi:hypothetical protein
MGGDPLHGGNEDAITLPCCTCKGNANLKRFANRPAQKKRPHEAGVKLLRQVSYRQETYRAVTLL